jgi:O-antigen ligase
MLVFCFGMALNQAMLVKGINASVADGILLLMLAGIVMNGRFLLPLRGLLFFLLLSILLITVPLIWVPILFHTDIGGGSIIGGYLKYGVVFLYFIFGYNIKSEIHIGVLLKGFVFGSVIMAILGLATLILNNEALNQNLNLGNERFQGLIGDPNYFAMLQVISLSIVLSLGTKKKAKIICSGLLLFSIIMSGSKTGFLITVAVVVVAGIIYLGFHKRFGFLLIGTLCGITGWIFFNKINSLIYAIQIPGVERLLTLSNGMESALTENGSGRIGVWDNAITIIKSSPIIGVGSGAYLPIAKRILGDYHVAHNSYLQLSAEWGIPLTALFFSYLAKNIYDSFFNLYRVGFAYRRLLAVIVILFMAGSLSISLNNARLFWIMIGMLMCYSDAGIEQREKPPYIPVSP